MKGYTEMIRILFVCHGNICRSPMAEFIMKDMIEQRGMSHLFEIASAATSREEIGNPVYPPVKRLLGSRGISCEGKKAVQIQPEDYDYYDYIIGAESVNVENIKRITGGDPKMKIYRLLDFTREPRDIADPWYTGDFQTACDETEEGCFSLLNILQPGGIFGEDGFSCSSHSDPDSSSPCSPDRTVEKAVPESPVVSVSSGADTAIPEPGIISSASENSGDSGEEEPGADLFRRYLDFKLGKGCTSPKEESLFLDYESVKKKEKSLDVLDEWTMEQIYLLLYHEMDWISKNKQN